MAFLRNTTKIHNEALDYGEDLRVEPVHRTQSIFGEEPITKS